MGQMDDVRVVLAIAEAGGLAAAERGTGLSRAALSRTLARVEARLGARLARRSARGFTLTEAGRFFLAECGAAMDRIAEVEARFRTGLDWVGPISVTAPPLLANAIIAPAVGALVTTRQGLRINLLPTCEKLDLVTGEIDLAFRVGDARADDIVAVTVAQAYHKLFAPVGWADRVSDARHPDALADLPFLHCGGDRPVTLHRGAETATLSIAPVVTVSDYQSIGPLMAAGVGVGLLPWFYGQMLCNAGEAIPVLPDWRGADIPIRALFADGRQPRDGVRDLVVDVGRRLKALG